MGSVVILVIRLRFLPLVQMHAPGTAVVTIPLDPRSADATLDGMESIALLLSVPLEATWLAVVMEFVIE
jgi:hypothetical protein